MVPEGALANYESISEINLRPRDLFTIVNFDSLKRALYNVSHVGERLL